MNRRASWLALAVAVVATAAGVAVFEWRSQRAAPSPAAELFYRQNLRDAGGRFQPMDTRRGQVVVVNFWATWCVPCVEEIPAFSKVNAAAAGRVAFVGLGIDSPDNIAAFNARFKPSYPLFEAGAGGTELARAFGNDSGALPFTVVLGPDGRVIASHLGRVDEKSLEAWLGPYLRIGSPSADSSHPMPNGTGSS